ncbi:MAG: DUF4405 domain-containing protein [Caldilineaceae bacterium]|jgi:hypothetical protein
MPKSGKERISSRTLWNWILDATVIVSGSVTAISGVYFLFLAEGFQGGRNPYYGFVILFERDTWTLIHMWSGVLMTLTLLLHLAIHTGWIGMMARKVRSSVTGRGSRLSAGARTNVLVDAAVALTFAVCAISGIYFLFVPHGGYQGGKVAGWDPGFLFTRLTWDLIHTWSGAALIVAALVHIAIHWLWLKKVTAKVARVAAAAVQPRPKTILQATGIDQQT